MADPIISRLNNPEYIALAEMQDRFIDMIYSFDGNFVMHGGTAIWRCYSGNRFSFDIDGYIRSSNEFELLNNFITFEISKRKMKLRTIRAISGALFIYITVSPTTELKVELIPPKNKITPTRANYERADGSAISILTLSPEDFIAEKIDAYSHRRYMRDLYDIFQLVNRVENKSKIRSKLRKFISGIENPIKEDELGPLIINGITPSFNDMVKYIGGKLK
jgi:predicted nucleotidyltransferase component of viral defense system